MQDKLPFLSVTASQMTNQAQKTLQIYLSIQQRLATKNGYVINFV